MPLDSKKLATLLIEIWENDDKRDYNLVKQSSTNLLKQLKLDSNLADLITETYKIHAEIDDKVKNDEKNLIRKFKPFEKKIATSIANIYKQNGNSKFEKIGQYHAAWWYYFMLKNHTKKKKFYLHIAWNLFLEQYNITEKLIPAIICTYYLILAGAKGHDLRNRQAGIGYLTNYWETLIKNSKNPLMF